MGAEFKSRAGFILISISLLFLAHTVFAEEPVRFADGNLKEAVENALNKENPTPFDMRGLEWLPEFLMYGYSFGICDIDDLTGLEYAVNLEALGIQSSSIDDYSVISELRNLRELKLISCGISDLAGVVSAIKGLEKLESLSFYDNQISDISLLTDFRGLKALNLQNNPLNEEAYRVHLPQIRKNNPRIEIAVAFRLTQLIAPAVVFVVFIIVALVFICRSWNTRGWIFESIAAVVAAGVGCFLGLGAQILYVYTDSFIEFFGNGYENPPWVGGVIGGVLCLLAGIWFAQYLRLALNEGCQRGRIVGRGVCVGIVLGILCSSTVHVLLMVAYRNPHLAPIFIGAIFGFVGGIITGLVVSVAFILTHRAKSIEPNAETGEKR